MITRRDGTGREYQGSTVDRQPAGARIQPRARRIAIFDLIAILIVIAIGPRRSMTMKKATTTA